jgi:hypothetical protein
MLCPSCKGDGLAETSSFKTTTEPAAHAGSTTVFVDLMSCKRCGAEFPMVRGKRRYILVPKRKWSDTLAELAEARQTESQVLEQLEGMNRRSQRLAAEIERVKARGEVSIMEGRVASMESVTKGLEGRRDRLKEAVSLIASRIP